MPAYVAFLRSVNVGGRTVKGPELVAAFDALGLQRPWTFLASGNVGFEAPEEPADALGARIAAGLQRALGFEVPTFVRSARELTTIAAHEPFDGQGTRFVAFASQPLDDDVVARLDAVGSATDRFHTRGTELYWSCAGGFSDSVFAGPRLERVVGCLLTVRKGTTLQRLAARLPG